MSSAIAVCVAILFAAFDVSGENASIHFRFLAEYLSGNVRFGGNVDASKLSQSVELDTRLEATSMRISSRKSANRAGRMIWIIVKMMRRFCSSQFFHNNSPNCATFDIAMLTSDVKLFLVYKAHTHTSSQQ